MSKIHYITQNILLFTQEFIHVFIKFFSTSPLFCCCDITGILSSSYRFINLLSNLLFSSRFSPETGYIVLFSFLRPMLSPRSSLLLRPLVTAALLSSLLMILFRYLYHYLHPLLYILYYLLLFVALNHRLIVKLKKMHPYMHC